MSPRTRPFHVERVVHLVHVNRAQDARWVLRKHAGTWAESIVHRAQIGLDSDERFVAFAIVRRTRASE